MVATASKHGAQVVLRCDGQLPEQPWASKKTLQKFNC
jgi:hypothetical protein